MEHNPEAVLKDYESSWAFFCPGCNRIHALDKDRWTFDGNVMRPTFTPSLLERSGHFVPKQKQPPHCYYCNNAAEEGRETFCGQCHVWIRDGQIEFLNDCTHSLRGLVPMIKVKDWPR